MLSIDPVNFELIVDAVHRATLRITVTNADGTAKNCAGFSAKLTVKDSIDDAIEAALFQLATPLANGIDDSAAAAGIFDAKFATIHTAAIAGKWGVWDFQITEPAKDPELVVEASPFFARKVVTTAGVPPALPPIIFPVAGDIQIIGGQIYIKDTGVGANAGKYWKLVVQDGVFDVQGPSVSVPF